MFRRLFFAFSLAVFAVPILAQATDPFRETRGFATKTGFRGVFVWSATRPVTAVVRYGTSPNDLSLTAQATPGLADTAGLIIANLEHGKTYYWCLEDTATGARSPVKSFVAKNAYNDWNGNVYTINLLVQLDLDSLPPDIPSDQALTDIAQGINVFAERVYDALDGYARLGTVVITDTNLDYAANVPFQTMPVCADGANLADVLVQTTVPLDSHTWAWAVDDPCTSFYVGRIGQLVLPWLDDLHFGYVSTHEMMHYAFGSPDLYAEGSVDSGVIADCRNTQWDGSVMHNSGGYRGQWELTELDRNPSLTPCNMGNNPYSWDVLRTRYRNVPHNPDGPIDHIIDEKARGNPDGGALEIYILDRENESSTLTPYTPVDTVPACGNLLPQVTDVLGDSTGVERFPGTPAPNEDSLDIEKGWLSWNQENETVTFHIKVKELTALPPVGALGQIFRFNFNYNDRRYQLVASRIGVVESRTLELANINAVPASATVLASNLPGKFDIDANEITIDLPWSAFGPVSANAPRFAAEQEFSKFEVIAQRYYGPALALTSDAGKGFCKYLVAQESHGPNDAPVANADHLSMSEDTSANLNVLANDTDANGDALYIRSVRPARGTASINNDNTIKFTPPANFVGEAFIEYTIGDRRGGTSTAKATINVTQMPDPPDAIDDNGAVMTGTPTSIAVLVNDTDRENDALTITGVTQGLLGKVTHDGKLVTYTPGGAFMGNDTFTYTISDGAGGSDTARVTVVRACAGTFSDDFEPAPESGWRVETSATLLGLPRPDPGWQHLPDPNSTDPTNHSFHSDASDASASKDDRLIAPPMRLNSGARLTFQHRFATEATFDGGVLEVSIDNGATWKDVTLAGGVFVRGGYNDALQAAGSRPGWGGISAAFPNNETVEVDLSALASKMVLVRWRLFTDSNSGNAGWWIDDVRFTSIASTDCGPAVNRAPNANDDEARTASNTAVAIAALANDSDPDEDDLTITAISDPPNGSVSNHGGALTYQPDGGFAGTDVFTYSISDGHGGSDTATVRVRVNKPPVANDDNVTADEDRAATFAVLGNDSDADGGALSVSSITQPIHGSASVNSDGSVSYTPDANYSGRDSFTYTVSDGSDTDSATVNVTVNDTNDAPSAVNDTASTSKNTAVIVNVLTNDGDGDGDPLRIDSISRPANGTAAILADGTIRYKPKGGFTGSDSFSYTISDGRGGVSTGFVTVTVTK
jgi:Bacterial Ig domain/Cadherin-like domain